MPTRFTAIPPVPLVGSEPWQVQLLNAMKENIELLTGTRGEVDFASAALTRAALTVTVPPEQTMTQISAQGNGVSINNTAVPAFEDYTQTLVDLQKLANDVAAVRATLEVLILQLRG